MVCSLGFLDLDAILGDGEQWVSPLLTQGLSHLNKTSYAPSSSYDVGPCPSNNDFCQEASPISFTSPRDGKGAARLSMTIATTAMRVTRLVQKALHMESDDVKLVGDREQRRIIGESDRLLVFCRHDQAWLHH